MDTVLLFALPLVGGLIFCSHWNWTRWRVEREEGHRLYFRAVLWGAMIFVLVAFTRAIVASKYPGFALFESSIRDAIKPMAKDAASASGTADVAITCFISMLLGLPLAALLNLGFWKKTWLRRALKKNELEAFLLDAGDRKFPIAITLDDGKVYVGYVVEGFDPGTARKTIQILPLMSGYRDTKKHKITFTTFYTELYPAGEITEADARKKRLAPPLQDLCAEDFIIVFPVDRIVSWRLFALRAYLEFQKRDRVSAKTAEPRSTP